MFYLACSAMALAQSQLRERGIPVNDPLVIAKCGACHTRDPQGNMQRISWERTTPEGWQEAIKRMVLADGVALTPEEARSIVKYLSASHGLAPEEAKPILYDVERRIHAETSIPNDRVDHACARCHSFARALAWRRSADDWKQLAELHATLLKLSTNDEAIDFLTKAAPLHTPEWEAWSAQTHTAKLTGRWLVSAVLRGHGRYVGELQMEPAPDAGAAGAASDGEFTTTAHLTSMEDGSTISRSGRGVVFAGYAWRGRSQGPAPPNAAPDDPLSNAREALWISPDQSSAQGRWFWGQYQEFGFDVQLRRPSADATLFMLDRPSLRAGSQTNRVRLIGDRLPARVTASDLDFGPGITVRGILSNTPTEIVAELDVASDALLGKHDVRLGKSSLPASLAVCDRIDYVKVLPESSMAAFGDQSHSRGYQQFEVVGYQRGPDGRLHTPDDIELGRLDPADFEWSLDVFYSIPGSSADVVGKISPLGFFAPAAKNPNTNFDVWVVATAKSLAGPNGKPLAGKSYMVVTVPAYTLGGRRYVRDLDRWVDDGPAQ